MGIGLGQGFLLAPPSAAPDALPMDLVELVAAHHARREAILNLGDANGAAA
jgi:hypothetical protein